MLVNDDDDDDDDQQQQQPIVFARVFGVVSERDTNAVKGATEKSFELFWWFLVPLREHFCTKTQKLTSSSSLQSLPAATDEWRRPIIILHDRSRC